MDIIKRVTELREQRGWSKNHLAKKSGLSQSTVSNLYNRPHEPTISTLESLCNGFGISLSEFFNADGDATFLTEEQKHLLSEWSKLSETQKQSIFNLIKGV